MRLYVSSVYSHGSLHSHWVSASVHKACEPSSPARQTVRSPLNKTSYPPAVLDASKRAFELPAEQGAFVFNQRKQSDLCFNPGLEREHSAFLKPAVDLEIVRGRLYPGKWVFCWEKRVHKRLTWIFFLAVFSWSRYMASSDISIPTTYVPVGALILARSYSPACLLSDTDSTSETNRHLQRNGTI